MGTWSGSLAAMAPLGERQLKHPRGNAQALLHTRCSNEFSIACRKVCWKTSVFGYATASLAELGRYLS